MDLDNLFITDLLDTTAGEPLVDTPVTSQAVGEEGDQPEYPPDTEIEPDVVVTSDAIGEEGDQPEPDSGEWEGGGCWDDRDDDSDDGAEEPADGLDGCF